MDEQITTSSEEGEFQEQSSDSFGFHSHIQFLSTYLPLLRAIKYGDTEIQWLVKHQFFWQYGDAIYSYFRKLGFDKEKAEELMSRINVKLADGTLLNTFCPSKHFRPYLKVVLLNVARDYLQEENRNILLDGLPEPYVRQAEKEIDRAIARAILVHAIKEARKRETKRRRSTGPGGVHLLVLMKGKGMSSTDLARRFDLTEYQVRGRVKTAIPNLVEEIREFFRRGGRTEKQIDNEIQDLLNSFGN